MKVLKIVGIILLIIVAVTLGISVILPSSAALERSIVIDAARDAVFAELDGFQTFNEFSAWFDRDPEARYVFSGPLYGVGAKLSWTSKRSDVGNGSMEIVEMVPYESVTLKLNFEGYKGDPRAKWLLSDEGDKTRLTYAYKEGQLGFVERFVFAFIKGSLAKDYEETLTKLKQRVESRPDFPMPISRETGEPIYFLGYSTTSTTDEVVLNADMAEGYGLLHDVLRGAGVSATGDPMAIFHHHDRHAIRMTLGLPVPEDFSFKGEEVSTQSLDARLVIRAVHYGNLENIHETHALIDEYMTFYKLDKAGDPWEVYVTPPETNPLDLTHVYYPVK